MSLKQPIDIPDMNRLEEDMTELAENISPFEVNLTGLELIEVNFDGLETGILWLNVQETKSLRKFHDRLKMYKLRPLGANSEL